MRVYRLIPNSFVNGTNQENFGIYCNDFLGAEDIYFEQGFVSFSKKIGVEDNEWTDDKSKHGKYFFLFLEDALQESTNFMQNRQGFVGNAYNIVIYDIPIEIILDNIEGIWYSDLRIQSFVPIKHFGNQINSNVLSNDDILNTCVELFKKTIQRESQSHILGYETFKYYGLSLEMDDSDECENYLLNLIEDEEKLRSVIANSPLYKQIILNEVTLYSPIFNTSVMFPVNGYLKRKNNQDYSIDVNNYLKDVGIYWYKYDMDYLKETKREITKLLKEDYWHQNEFEGNIRQETREKIRSRLLKIK